MSNVAKFKQPLNNPNMVIDELVEQRDKLEALIVVKVYKDGAIAVRTSRVNKNDFCMASMMVQREVFCMLAEGAEYTDVD